MECSTIERYELGLPVYKPKRKFKSMEEAINFAKKINSKDHTIHKLVSYKCEKCFKYHVGRNGKEVTQKEKKKWKK